MVARELTKIYEELIRGSVSQVLETVSQGKVRGEIVILIEPGEKIEPESLSLEETLQTLMRDDALSLKDAAKKAAEITGVSRSEAYSAALKLRDEA